MIQPRLAVALISALAIVSSIGSPTNAQGRGRAYGGVRLSGTYELDRARSDNAQQVARRVTSGLPASQRDRVYQNVVSRLEAPELLSLDIHGRTVTMMSTNAQQLTFEADGRTRTEVGPGGRQVTTRTDLRGAVVTISMVGSRGNEYTATFEPSEYGLRVTRRLDNGYNRTPVLIVSEYRKIGDARWNLTSDARGGIWANAPRGRRTSLFMPAGTVLTTQLDRAINTNTIRNGDRISLTVTEPARYRGTVIEGVVGREPGGDDDNILVDFDLIRLTDGRTGGFEGVIESVRLPDGKVIRVDQSGAVRGDDAGHSNSVRSGAIGAGVGAIIGAIIGGTKGAVVGGVAGGAGGIILDRTGNTRTLPAGTTMTVSAVSSGSAVTRR
jgi:hypothetical protein